MDASLKPFGDWLKAFRQFCVEPSQSSLSEVFSGPWAYGMAIVAGPYESRIYVDSAVIPRADADGMIRMVKVDITDSYTIEDVISDMYRIRTDWGPKNISVKSAQAAQATHEMPMGDDCLDDETVEA